MTDDTAAAIPATKISHSGPLAALRERIAIVEIETPVEQVLETRNSLLFMLEQVKAMKAALDLKLIEWIETNGTIQIGSKRIFVGANKITRCNGLRPALEALMQECGGDWEQFCDCLASDAIKPGAAKSVLGGPEWSQHFTVKTKMEIREGEEKAVKELVEIDERFLAPNKKGRK